MEENYTVSRCIPGRLQEIGVKHLFGVPGGDCSDGLRRLGESFRRAQEKR